MVTWIMVWMTCYPGADCVILEDGHVPFESREQCEAAAETVNSGAPGRIATTLGRCIKVPQPEEQ